MKRLWILLVEAAFSLLPTVVGAQAQSSITFVVDEDLTPIKDSYEYLVDGEDIANSILNNEDIPEEMHHIVTTSFADNQCLVIGGKDAFYKSIIRAYASHKSITLSPDMIWLLISQGFARYVNAHAEELRPQLVSHIGKMDLKVETRSDLLSKNADWSQLLDDFSVEIDRNTKGDISKTITADFSTTGQVERIASQITLMESVKSYFNYIAFHILCGIPSITLKGTPDDWRLVLKKTQQLEAYGLSDWTKSLEPILMEFISAAEGKPKQSFWQEIVRKHEVDMFCGKETTISGWLLKFFPDGNGHTRDDVDVEKEMPSDRVRVNFKYRILAPDGTIISETPMELWAGFVGAEVDTITNSITPKIGWLVRKAVSDDVH